MKFSDLIDGRKNNLNLIRLIAATAVALSHSYNFTGQLHSEPLLKLTGDMTLGFLAVFAFFVISGLLVAQSYDRTSNIFGFLASRALRLYPALVVALLFCAYLLGSFFTTLDLSEYFFRDEVRRYVEDNILFKENQSLPGVFMESKGFTVAVNGSIWSLRYEAYCYLLLLLGGIIGLISNRTSFNLAVVVLLLIYLKEPAGILIVPGSWSLIIWVPLLGFIFGVLIYVNRNCIDCKISYVIVGFGIYILLRNHVWIHVIFVVTIGYVILTFGFHRLLQFHLPLANDYSYGIYLYAFPVQQAIMHTVPTESPMLLFVLTMLVTFPLAMASWHFIEKPALKLKKLFYRDMHKT